MLKSRCGEGETSEEEEWNGKLRLKTTRERSERREECIFEVSRFDFAASSQKSNEDSEHMWPELYQLNLKFTGDEPWSRYSPACAA